MVPFMKETPRDQELARIGKIIAHLDSPNEAEAVAALRLARTRLAELGMTLADWQRLQARTLPVVRTAQTQTPPTAAPATDWQRIAMETADRLWQLGEELAALGLDQHLDSLPRAQRPVA